MGRLRDIESLGAGTVNSYTNVKMIVRGRPQYLDPQLVKGTLRFAQVRGSSFGALQPANRFSLTQTAPKGSTVLTLESRPSWFQIGCLVRVGVTERVGELQIVQDLIDPLSLEVRSPLAAEYAVGAAVDQTPQCSLLGTPASFIGTSQAPLQRRVLLIESWYQMVPGDSILASSTPDVLTSLSEHTLGRANLIGTRPGVESAGEPATIWKYECELSSGSGLLPFVPSAGTPLYLKAQPLFYRQDFASGDIKLPPTLGPCAVDAFYGGLLYNQKTHTVLGIKTYDVFGNQLNYAAAGNQQWQVVPSNYVMLQRPIPSESLLLWKRIQGRFQLIRTGNIFQAQLDGNGQFVMSSDMLVPPWDSTSQHGWVIPVTAESDVTVSVQFEPQERQYFTVPHSALTLIRPKIFADPAGAPITRVVVAIQGAPNSSVQIRDWMYDGSAVNSLSYFILGTGAAFGLDRWLAGGFSLKPVFLDLNVLKASYSDGVSTYDSGLVYL